MTGKCLTVCVLTVVCGVLAGCSDGSEMEIERLQKERGRQDETLRQLNGELFALRETLFRLSQQQATLSGQFEAMRAQNDGLTRQRGESADKLEWTQKQMAELETTVNRQAETLAKSPDPDARLAELGRTVTDLGTRINQLKTRLSAVEAECDRLRKVCRTNGIDPATGARTAVPPTTTPNSTEPPPK